jgi:hypothetical protein
MWRKFAGIRLTAVCAVIRWKSTGKPPSFFLFVSFSLFLSLISGRARGFYLARCTAASKPPSGTRRMMSPPWILHAVALERARSADRSAHRLAGVCVPFSLRSGRLDAFCVSPLERMTDPVRPCHRVGSSRVRLGGAGIGRSPCFFWRSGISGIGSPRRVEAAMASRTIDRNFSRSCETRR